MTSTEQELEQEIQDKELIAPRLTPELIDHTIDNIQYHIFPDSLHTVCCITLINGFTVIGASACVSPENFDKELGEKIAFQNARNEIWQLEAYKLQEALYTQD